MSIVPKIKFKSLVTTCPVAMQSADCTFKIWVSCCLPVSC